MGAHVVELRPSVRAFVDPATLPDPGPALLADVRELIDRIGQSFGEIAEAVNRLCGTNWLDGALVARWYVGEGEVLARQLYALISLAGAHLPSLGPTLV